MFFSSGSSFSRAIRGALRYTLLGLFDLQFVFNVLGWVFYDRIVFGEMNPLGVEIDLHVLDKLLKIPVLLTQLVDDLPVKYLPGPRREQHGRRIKVREIEMNDPDAERSGKALQFRE